MLFRSGRTEQVVGGEDLLELDYLANIFRVGAVTGNPRIRTRSTLVGKIQVGEYSSIIGFVELTGTGIDEQPDRRHKRWQGRNDGSRLQRRYGTGAFCVKHKTQGVSSGLDRSQSVFYAGNTADLAANNGHLDNTPNAKAPDGNKCLSGRQPSSSVKPVKKCGPM